jgi:hypothetical protein
MSTRITIAGVGMVPFRQAGHSDSYGVMAETAVRAALEDARLDYVRPPAIPLLSGGGPGNAIRYA